MAGPGSTKPRMRGPLRCGQRFSMAYTSASTRKSAMSVPPTRTRVRPRGSRSASRATATQLPFSGDIAPEAHHRLPVGGAESDVLAERVDAVAGALEVGLHARKVAPPVRVLVLQDPREPALDRLLGSRIV